VRKRTKVAYRGTQYFMWAASQKKTLAYFTVRELHLELAVFTWKIQKNSLVLKDGFKKM
jgi:hypothetical protein